MGGSQTLTHDDGSNMELFLKVVVVLDVLIQIFRQEMIQGSTFGGDLKVTGSLTIKRSSLKLN